MTLNLTDNNFKADPAAVTAQAETIAKATTNADSQQTKSRSFFDTDKPKGQPAKSNNDAEPKGEQDKGSQPDKKPADNQDSEFSKKWDKFVSENPNFKGKTIDDVFESVKNAQKKIQKQSEKIKALEGKKAEEESEDKKSEFAEKIKSIKEQKESLINDLKKDFLDSGIMSEETTEKFIQTLNLLADSANIEELQAKIKGIEDLSTSLQQESEAKKQSEKEKAELQAKQQNLFKTSNKIFNELIAANEATTDEINDVIKYLQSDDGIEEYYDTIEKLANNPDALYKKYSSIVKKEILSMRGKKANEIIRKGKEETAKAFMQGKASEISLTPKNSSELKNNSSQKSESKSLFGFNIPKK